MTSGKDPRRQSTHQGDGMTTQTLTLELLIDQQINLGHKNPHEFFDRIQGQLGDGLFEVAKPHLADFIAEMGRQRLNAQRRSAIAKITTGDLDDPEIQLKSLWIPSDGDGGIIYKRIADMTADDFDARANYLERMIIGISRSAAWCRSVATELRRNRLATAGELKTLPALPDIDDLG